MIVDLERFFAAERPYWNELEAMLRRIENDPAASLNLAQLERFHYLYQRSLAGLARIGSMAAAPEVRAYLESLVARAYGEMQETGRTHTRLAPWRWFTSTFPQTFRRWQAAFWLATAVTLGGCAFGVLSLIWNPDSKRTLMPFGHLLTDPRERVMSEENQRGDRLAGARSSFSAELMTHNTRVAMLTASLGMTWGIGTVSVLFYNGVILGAVSCDYIRAGQARFLAGWLLPHGSVEIPAILLAGQAGFLLANALVGWGRRNTRRQRLREIAPEVATLLGGAACLLVWAAIVEAFFSQYHEPLVPYGLKIAFGSVQLGLLTLFLAFAGRGRQSHR